jgi:protein-S-isoprenylcysteine O-methyltransferase Ste14
MTNVYPILLGVFLSALALRMLYERLKRSGRLDPRNRLVFLVIFAVMCLLWASWFALCPLDPFRMPPPRAVSWLGWSLTALGSILAIGALIGLRGVENIDHLVTRGIFAHIRHPMYCGFVLWIVGWASAHGAWLSLAAGTAGIACILTWRRQEEEDLVARWGDEYREYRRRTWF